MPNWVALENNVEVDTKVHIKFKTFVLKYTSVKEKIMKRCLFLNVLFQYKLTFSFWKILYHGKENMILFLSNMKQYAKNTYEKKIYLLQGVVCFQIHNWRTFTRTSEFRGLDSVLCIALLIILALLYVLSCFP